MAVLSRRALRTPETFDAWLDAFGRALAAVPGGDLPACPNCGRFDLELRFVADPSTRIGFASMWSPFCGHGIRVSRVEVPSGVEFLAVDASPEELAAQIPSFTEIGPSGPASSGPAGSDLGDKLVRLQQRRGPLTIAQIASELDLAPEPLEQVVHQATSSGAVVRADSGELALAG